jgi:hypothetical protein
VTSTAVSRSAIICLLPAGRRAIEDAAPQHVQNVRRQFIDLFTPAELDTLTALNERVLTHLTEESLPGESTPDEPAPPHYAAHYNQIRALGERGGSEESAMRVQASRQRLTARKRHVPVAVARPSIYNPTTGMT